ncbi:pilus assembly protein [Brevundimonas sp. S30B]|uniref:TadE/TadG family type IV pilus assembly protein n=1 Tax=unclassified Brevundimonas TaxID=2622653 RepID=UPI001071C6AD|nr:MULTISPECIES: TadE/TadG family type IV pilus assembly protein [unclassified Brevundimonas]QBX37293.1 pilus assembly protein [Brevundimonas sp. MF30-B]TFW03914.1 pilus assembly protein [Brevundimonas sp. S30B]
MTALLRRLRRDQRGLSAVEFALLAPIMVFFYFGLVEFCQGYMAQKRMGHVASQVADLVAQSDSVTGAQVDDIFSIGALIMRPFTASGLTQRVSSVTRDSSGVAKVDWSRGSGEDALERNFVVTGIPTGLIGNGESLIMAEATYNYRSPANYLMPGLTKFSQRYYLRPRTVNQVAYSE